MENWIPIYFQKLGSEIEYFGRIDNKESLIHTIFFGGGTPNLVPPEYYEELMKLISKNFVLDTDLEISMEANPGVLDKQRFEEYSRIGINRVSFGAQSFQAAELSLLGRIHSSEDIDKAVTIIRDCGIRNLNLDLIYGIPGQSISRWKETLVKALEIHPEHLSLYCLTLEDGTSLQEQVKSGHVLPLPDDDAADQYDLAIEFLNNERYLHYEISNWARKDNHGEDNRCLHNLQYWKNEEYYGFGAGAHGYIRGQRYANFRPIPAYITHSQSDGNTAWKFEVETKIDLQEMMKDEMMLGLRLIGEGVYWPEFLNKFGVDYRQVFSNEIEKLITKGLLEWKNGEHLILSKRGIPLANAVFREFV